MRNASSSIFIQKNGIFHGLHKSTKICFTRQIRESSNQDRRTIHAKVNFIVTALVFGDVQIIWFFQISYIITHLVTRVKIPLTTLAFWAFLSYSNGISVEGFSLLETLCKSAEMRKNGGGLSKPFY